MKQKDISQQLGSLISAQGNLCGNNTNVNDELPSELEEPAPEFEFDAKSELEKSKKDAEVSMNYIVDAVVPTEFRNHPSIVNQIKLDSIQLGSLYYQQNVNNIVIESSLTKLASGDNNPRLYEVIEKLQKRASQLSEQITNTHAQFRKYYIDTYLDIESKIQADEEDEKNLRIESETEKKKDSHILTTNDGMVRIGGTKAQNKELQKRKIEALKHKLALLKQKSEEADEVEDLNSSND